MDLSQSLKDCEKAGGYFVDSVCYKAENSSFFESFTKPKLSLNGLVGVLQTIVIVLIMVFIGLILFKTVIASVITLGFIAIGFAVSFFLFYKYAKGYELSSLEWALVITLPILFILASGFISSVVLTSLPFSIAPASVSGVSIVTTATPMDLSGVTATFLPTIIILSLILMIIVAYSKIKKGDV